MSRIAWLIALAISLVVLSVGLAQSDRESPPAKPSLLEQGQYLVERVGMCQDCHTPRDESGEFDMTQWLQGSELGFEPLHPMPWASVAPAIAGLNGYTDAEAQQLLMTAKLPDGSSLMPPMPHYRLRAEDAAAVVAYLRSLADSE
jgi:mono/diheme cytochrome c family protein